MLSQFISSALIIDDSLEEVSDLCKFLEEKDIWVKHYTPSQLDELQNPFKNRKLIFMDLQLDDTDSTINNIARIRKYLRTFIADDFGAYGMVLWTKHADEIDALREKIALDFAKYTVPLFIVGLDKTKYLNAGNYGTVLDDLEIELKQNIAARFFIEWTVLVNRASDKTISEIFRIEPDYKMQEQNLKFILFQIGKNYTGIPNEQILGHNLTKDTIKGFSDMLHYEIVSLTDHNNFLFNNANEFPYSYLSQNDLYEYSSSNHLASKAEEKKINKNGIVLTKAELKKSPDKEIAASAESKIVEIYSHLNSRLLIDSHNLNQAIIMPGNIYEIVGESMFKLEQSDLPEGSKNIIIEVTPPCDFANSKKGKMSRIVAGYICNYTIDNYNSIKQKGENYYKEIWPVNFREEKSKLFAFDFRYFGAIAENDLKDPQKYLLLSKAKDKLFADILQKLASHTARLGLSVIH